MTRAATFILLVFTLSSCAAIVQSHGDHQGQDHRKLSAQPNSPIPGETDFEVYIAPQVGRKMTDKIVSLPGQPKAEFNQYSGYVTVDIQSGSELFYYFVEAISEPAKKPLVLWLNGGPGCSSLGGGAMTELGPFRPMKDGTLQRNQYAWNKKANIIFLESPVGVGFSYSRDQQRYMKNSDGRTAQDSYTFLVNWLERYPEYKNRDFYIMGESYAGHYVPQLAQLILQKNKKPNQSRIINLRGIALGNPALEVVSREAEKVEFAYMHSIISKAMRDFYFTSCNGTNGFREDIDECLMWMMDFISIKKGLNEYNIFSAECNSSSDSPPNSKSDPCIEQYTTSYLNNRQVQEALHVNVAATLKSSWKECRDDQIDPWLYDMSVPSVLPIIKELMDSGIRLWIYSGDVDGVCPTLSTQNAIEKLGAIVKTKWYPWLNAEKEVGGFAEEYHNLTFMTIRGSGHLVPADQPARAFTVVSSFLEGKLPPLAEFAS